jgi:alkylation response protein AidB-like acyl-CoA dehydrogenase
MDLQVSEEQELLRQTGRDFLERECPMALVRAEMEDPVGHPQALWDQMAELGWMGLMVDEVHGGSGLDLVDLAILLEEMGRALTPGPFLTTAVLGALAIQRAGTAEQKTRLLPQLVEGRLRIALAQLEETTSWEPGGIQLFAKRSADGYSLSGRKLFVTHAACADLLIVPVRTERPDAEASVPTAGISLLLVDTDSRGLSRRPIAFNEQTRKVCEVGFDEVFVPTENLLGTPGAGWPLLSELLDHGRVAVCAELCGSAQKVLELSVAYARERKQFGQPIGRFQALQHKCANMLIKAEGIRSAAYYAAWSLAADDPDKHQSACLAKAYCCDAYAAISGDGIQIHGGLGFSWEQDLHLYFKHGQAAKFAFGDPELCRELAARTLIDTAPGCKTAPAPS